MERPICAGCFVSLSCGVWMSAPLFDFWESRLSDFPFPHCLVRDLAAPPLPSDALLVGEATSPLRPSLSLYISSPSPIGCSLVVYHC